MTPGMTLLFAALLGASMNMNTDDLTLSDFSTWTATGTAFAGGPVSGSQLVKLEIENTRGHQVVSSETEGDVPQGTLTSPSFKVGRRYISFLIGGGDYERDTCVNLLVKGKVVKSATGWRSDRLVPVSWDVSRFKGESAQIQIVDQASGDWGHINVAAIAQTDKPERLPVVTEPLYKEALRPQFHFTARQWTMDRLNPGPLQEGWINDLNGLIYYEGEYHLFAQRWWKCWLHAVSKDLIHWTEMEPAFWEEHNVTGSQSGTCVIDYDNTSGLGVSKDKPPMVAFWSRNENRSHCISYSLDKGRTWKYYEKNPFMVCPERDPKVFWYKPGKHWVMFLYGEGQYHIFTSSDLLHWKDAKNPIRGSFECPDFFELPIDGDKKNTKWVLIQGNGNYSIGTFNGVKFTEEVGRFPCDIGPNFYATQTWSNVETGDGRRIQAAWMRFSNFPEMPFSQMVSFPCELTLRTTPSGLRVFREPIREIAALHDGSFTYSARTLQAGQSLPLEPSGQLFHIRAKVSIAEGAKLVFTIRGESVVMTSKTIENGTSPAAVHGVIKTIEFLVDRTSIETYVNNGEVSSTRFVLPKENGLSVKAEGGTATIDEVTIYHLKSAWPDKIEN